MNDPVAVYISGIRLGAAQIHENLTLIPLLCEAEVPLEYVTLDEAMRLKLVEITEVGEAGSVPDLKVLNRSRSKILIIDGEELVGAKQNRISNASFLIPEESEKVIPVSCIEAGRWRWASKSFGSSDSMYALMGRRSKLQSTTSFLRAKREYRSDQGEVWGTVARYLGSSGTFSPTDSFVDYHEKRKADLAAFVAAFSSEADQVGVMILINGQLQGMDTFGKRITWRGVFPKLVRSYAMDAIVRMAIEPAAGGGALLSPEGFLRAVAEAPRQAFDSVGEGKDFRIETDEVIGAALVLNESLLHLTAFPKSPVPSRKPAAV